MLEVVIYVLTGIIAFWLGKNYGYEQCKTDLQKFLRRQKENARLQRIPRVKVCNRPDTNAQQ